VFGQFGNLSRFGGTRIKGSIFVLGGLGALILGAVAHGQETRAVQPEWKDGFLEKKYNVPAKWAYSAIDALLGRTEIAPDVLSGGPLAISKDDGKDGSTTWTYGVGDENGKYGEHWKGIPGIAGLKLKSGGSRIQIKVTERGDHVLVAFRADDGDRPSSETLHELLGKKMPARSASQCAAAGAGAVEYVQTAYPVYKVRGGMANLSETMLSNDRTIRSDDRPDLAKLAADDLGAGLPEEQTPYAEEMGKRFQLRVTRPTQSKCDLAFQDVAYLKTADGKRPLMVLAYKGCPFSVNDLAGMPDVSMRAPLTIEVASARGDVLVAQPTSAVPFIVTSESTYPCFTAIGIQWRFTEQGTMFSTPKGKYRTTKAGATISFDPQGVRMDGVEAQ
jgi:hypothetical protein